MKIACLDVYEEQVKEVIRKHVPIGWQISFASSYEEEAQKMMLADSDMILAGWSPVPGWMMNSGKIKFVQKFGIGYDKIDIEAARKEGVGVAIAAGSNAVPVSELVILFILALYRKLLMLDQSIRNGQWLKAEMRSQALQISGKTVGLIGMGAVGKEVAKRLNSFEANVIYHDIFQLGSQEQTALQAEFVSLESLLERSDIVSLHLPYTKETSGIMNKSNLGLMKKEAILINTARGELIDEKELVDALKHNRLLGAGLDVFSQEPIAAGHPLLSLDNVILTPHIGGTIFDNVERVARHCFENMSNYVADRAIRDRDVIVKGKPYR